LVAWKAPFILFVCISGSKKNKETINDYKAIKFECAFFCTRTYAWACTASAALLRSQLMIIKF